MKKNYFTLIILSLSLHATAQINGGTTVDNVTIIKRVDNAPEIIKSQNVTAKSVSTLSAPTGNSTEVGVTEGQLTVSLGGGANYSVPIAVPPGINGIVPQISLSYNSQSGFQGTAAQGWNIAGISTISRIPSTKFHDGVIDPVDFDALDRFAFDGQRLIIKSGTSGVYGASGTVYETENFSNVKITSYGVHPNGASYGPAYFLVEYPNGSKAFYGNSGDSRSVTDWSITNWINPQGVQISYEYIISTNTSYISSVKYGNLSTTSPINEIQFFYGTRTASENGYLAGINVIRDKNLSEIKVIGNGVGFRNYKLRYDKLDKITQIDEKSGDNTKSYNPTLFQYTYLTDAIHYLPITSVLNLSNITTKNTASISGDFDTDGKMDLILYRTSGTDIKNKYWMYRDINTSNNNNIGFQHNIGAFEDIFPINAINSNNVVLPQGWAVAKKTETNYTFTVYSIGSTTAVAEQYNKIVNFTLDLLDETCNSQCVLTSEVGRIFPKKVLSGDFNGDGLTDVIAIDISASRKDCKENVQTGRCTNSNEVALSKKVYFVDLKRDNTTNFLFYAGELSTFIGTATKIEVADLNGDGRSDFFVFEDNYVKVYTLSETNTLVLLYQNTIPDAGIVSALPVLMGDYNGDGKSDFMIPLGYGSSKWNKYTSTGISLLKEEKNSSATLESNNATNTYTYFSSDINNDGRTDILSLSSNKNAQTNVGTVVLFVYTNFYGEFPSLSPAYSVQDTSINLDMLPIYLPHNLQSLKNGVNVVNSTLEIAFVNENKINYFSAEQNLRQGCLLVKITNGNGVEETIDYSTIDSKNRDIEGNSIYTPSTTVVSFPNLDIKMNPNLYLVSKIEKHSTTVNKKRFFYYYGAVSNMQGLGFMGFRSLNQTDWHDDATTIFSNVFNNEIDLRGANTEKFIVPDLYYPDGYSAPGNFSSKSVITYNTSADALQANKVFKLKILNSKELNSLYNTNNETTNIVYDSYNNITSSSIIVKEGPATISTTNLSINYENTPDSSPYVIGRPLSQSKSVSISGDTMTSEEVFTYSNSLLTETKKKGINTDYITEHNQFDNFGNIIKKTTSAPSLPVRETNYQYDLSGRFLTKITDNDLLSTTFEYNQNNGLLMKETSPYQLSTSYTYDSWFKKLSVTDDKLNKAITYTYSRNGEKTVVATTTDALDGGAGEEIFDELGRKIRSGKKDLNGNFSYVSYLYDIFDRNTHTSEPYFGTSPTQWNETKFDIYSRPTENKLFNSRTTSVGYSGLTSTFVDGQKSKTSVKNALGNVVSMTETLGGTINYSYFANGNLKETDYNGVKIAIEQDGWGHKTKLTDPSAGVFTYTNNPLGELIVETSQNGAVTTTISRDNSGRIIKKTILGAGTDNETIYNYDSGTKLLLSTNFIDRTEPGNTIITTYTYDNDFKRITSIIEEKAGISKFTTNYSYDALGRISTETKEAQLGGKVSSITTTNVYKNGVLHQIRDNSGKVLWQTNTINAKGQVLESVMGNGITMTNEYDSKGYLSKIQHDKTGLPNIITLTTEFDFNTDNLNKRINSAFGNYTENFEYDEISRLKKFTNKSGILETQNYEASGKIKDNNLGTYNYSAAKPYQNTSITLTPEPIGYYGNREGIYNDSMEERTGWSRQAYNPQCISFDNTIAHTGKNSLKINTTGLSVSYVQSDVSIPINNNTDTEYTFSGWVYSDGPAAGLTLFMLKEGETSYYTNYKSVSTNAVNQWYFLNETFLVPANIRNISLRLDNLGTGNTWFDDVQIRKTSNAPTTDRKLNITYNAFKSPIQIEETGVDKISFTYNTDNQRSTMYYGDLQSNKLLRPLRKHYSADGSVEIKENITTGATEFVTYIGGNGYSAPLVVKSDGVNTANYLYLHRDYQGTILAITDANATVVEKHLFDAWGSIIRVQDAAGNNLAGLTVLDRGYTGHEHLQSVGLINMNARLYDPLIHRFLQVDNYIQDVTNTQNYNPYSYVLNNPLLYTDPSGNLSAKILSALWENSDGAGGSTMWYGDGSGNFDKGGTNEYVNRDGEYGRYDGVAVNLPGITINSKSGDGVNARLIQDHVYANSEFYNGNNNLQRASIIDGNTSIFDVANIGIGIYGYGIAQGQKVMMTAASVLKNKSTLTSLAKLAKLNVDIARAGKIAQGLGIAGAILTTAKVSLDYFNGKDLTWGQAFDVGFSIGLAALTVTNPVAIVGFAAYGILDATGALDSIKSSLGGDTVLLKSNFNK